jgi:hypothetical protein
VGKVQGFLNCASLERRSPGRQFVEDRPERVGTGRFANITGASFIMVATTEPFVLGDDDPVGYSWHGEGTLTYSK